MSAGLAMWAAIGLITSFTGWAGARWRTRGARQWQRTLRRDARRQVRRAAADEYMNAFRGGPR